MSIYDKPFLPFANDPEIETDYLVILIQYHLLNFSSKFFFSVRSLRSIRDHLLNFSITDYPPPLKKEKKTHASINFLLECHRCSFNHGPSNSDGPATSILPEILRPGGRERESRFFVDRPKYLLARDAVNLGAERVVALIHLDIV